MTANAVTPETGSAEVPNLIYDAVKAALDTDPEVIAHREKWSSAIVVPAKK